MRSLYGGAGRRSSTHRASRKRSCSIHIFARANRAISIASELCAKGLPGYEPRPTPVADERGPCITPIRYGFRSFDRQWIIPDNRLINQPNPELWESHSEHQVYLTALKRQIAIGGASAHVHRTDSRPSPLQRSSAAARSHSGATAKPACRISLRTCSRISARSTRGP